MGWVSLLEDKIDRYTSELHNIKSSLIVPSTNGGASLNDDRRLQELVSAVDGLLRLIRDNLDLATSPEMNLVFELTQLKKENEELKQRIVYLGEKVLENIKAKKASTSLVSSNMIPNLPLPKAHLDKKQSPSQRQEPLVACEHCRAKVKEGRYSTHIKKVHPDSLSRVMVIAKPNPQNSPTVNESKKVSHAPSVSAIGQFNGIRLIELNRLASKI